MLYLKRLFNKILVLLYKRFLYKTNIYRNYFKSLNINY